MSDNSPRLELPYIQPAQAQKHVTHNEALRVLDVVVQLSVVAFAESTPPSLANEGDIYAIGPGAGGVWAGHDGELAVFIEGAWQFHVPQPGWVATRAASTEARVWTGTAWEVMGPDAIDNLEHLGVNTTADGTNRLAVASDGALFTHDGSDHRVAVNKASAADTASLVFQSNWSGRAEMGLAGSNDFAIKVSPDGSAWTEALAIDQATGGLAAGQIAASGLDLAAISTTKALSAVDVFIYDTTRDSDGGAWRTHSQHTGWHAETLATATRGARRDFPVVAVIVAEADRVTIYDGDDPALPMWRIEDYAGLTLTSVAALNGRVAIGAGTGLVVSDYASDALGSTAPTYTTATSSAIVNNAVSGVAMTVLAGAPIAATGLPAPTVAAATLGGVSVIAADGAVYDSGKATACIGVTVSGDRLRASYSDGTTVSTGLAGIVADGFTGTTLSVASAPALVGAATSASGDALGSASGLALLAGGDGMAAYITTSYTTGWMPGDIKGAWLADTNAADLVGGTDADRSAHATALNVAGTITREPVAPGADLVGYSGFSASNYLVQPYNPELDFGTGDFCGLGWFKADGALRILVARYAPDGANPEWNIQAGSGVLRIAVNGALVLSGTTPIDDGAWHFMAAVRESGVLKLYVDGRLDAQVSNATNLNNPNARLGLGVVPLTSPLFPLTGGALSLVRITATAIGAAQIAAIYGAEKHLFEEHAACTLYGASDAVTALAHDPMSGLVHVGTSAGRSDFQGLRRTNHTETAVTTAISAANGLIVEQ